jgi:hypothetical protein
LKIPKRARHDIAEILLKLALNTNQSINQSINKPKTAIKSVNRMFYEEVESTFLHEQVISVNRNELHMFYELRHFRKILRFSLMFDKCNKYCWLSVKLQSLSNSLSRSIHNLFSEPYIYYLVLCPSTVFRYIYMCVVNLSIHIHINSCFSSNDSDCFRKYDVDCIILLNEMTNSHSRV